MAANAAPDAKSWCIAVGAIEVKPAIHLPGGALLEAPVDPTKGTPGACGLNLPLMEMLQSALAPFQPVLTIIDTVATLGQFAILMSEVISNPLKIIELLQLVPVVVAKVNELLALVPPFPQGIVQYVTFVVDVLRYAGTQIACLVTMLQSIQNQITALGTILQQITSTDDPAIKADLQLYYDCAQANMNIQIGTTMAVMGPLARIVCLIRTVLALTGDEGKELAKKLSFPDPSQIKVLQAAIDALSLVRDIILGAVDLIVAIAAPFGGIFPPPPLVFECPLDTSTDTTPPVVPPTITDVRDAATSAIITQVPYAANPTTDAPYRVVVNGTGFDKKTKVFWGTSEIKTVLQGGVEVSAISFISASQMAVDIPAAVRGVRGNGLFTLVNEPQKKPSPFSGIAQQVGGAITSETKVSTPYELEVV
jgi:hypothetical protein